MTSPLILALLCACALQLVCVQSSTLPPKQRKEVIIAPSERLSLIAGLETREQGSTAWICSKLDAAQPWNAYADIRSYMEGGNSEHKDYTGLILYPVMELTHSTALNSKLCVYLPSVDHCFPPKPSTSSIVAVKQLLKRTYYAIRFWGQASDARVAHYRHQLNKAIAADSKTADLDLFYLSYFPDHVREVRYDHKR